MDEEGQWRAADAVPHFQEPGFHLPHIRAYIDVGSFLIVKPPVNTNGVDRCLLVCRFVKTAISGETMALVCNRFDVLRATGTGANLLSRHMDRVEQTACIINVNPESVVDIVFVFKQKDIDNLEYVAQGRRDSFVLFTNSPATDGFFSFPCQYGNFNFPISLSRRIWRDMDTIRRCFRKILCSERMHQSTFAKRRDKIGCSDEAWAYLLRRVDDVIGVTSTGTEYSTTTVRADYEITPAMRAVAKRRRLTCHSIAFNGEEGIKAFNALFGESSTLGIREKRPLLDKPERRVGVNDTLSFCSYIYLKFCEGTVYVCVHYKAYVYDTDPLSQTGQPLHCPDDQLYRFLSRRPSKMEGMNLYPAHEMEQQENENEDEENNNQHEFDVEEAKELLPDGARLLCQDNRMYRVLQSLGEDEHSMVKIELIGNETHQTNLIPRRMAVYFRKLYIS
jgi:hypothetical protein